MMILRRFNEGSLPKCCVSLIVIVELHIPMVPLSLKQTRRAMYTRGKFRVIRIEDFMKELMHGAIVESIKLVQRLGFRLDVRRCREGKKLSRDGP